MLFRDSRSHRGLDQGQLDDADARLLAEGGSERGRSSP